MPTSAASGASLPRICAASSPTRLSGSGSEALMGGRIVEIALQDEGRGERIDIALARCPRARRAQPRLRLGREERLVHERDREPMARGEAPGELLRELR